jgi:hypothetical protein
MHPTPKCYTLMCGRGFRLFKGNGLIIAFLLALWLMLVAGIIPKRIRGHRRLNRECTISEGIIEEYYTT